MIGTGIDIETTGLDFRSGHRIIEIALSSYNILTREKIVCLEMRFNPRRTIQPEAQKVHGISLEMLATAPLFEDKAPEIMAILEASDFYIAHNGEGFDGPFLQNEFKQTGFEMPEKPMFDTMLEGLWATEDGKRPRLQELAFAMGLVYDTSKAHCALYDVDLMMECFFIAREKYNLFQLPFAA